MKKTRNFLLALSTILLFYFIESAYANKNSNINNQRMEIIKQYVKLLGQGNYKKIPQLFTKDAITVSSSGAYDNPTHFYQTLFTKTISNPQSSLINIFESSINANMMIGYFDFSWNNIDGKKVSAKFLDLFVYEEQSTKIKSIFVFSNTFQQDIMKKLEAKKGKLYD